MAEDKKISPKEAGIAVLKKFEELLVKAEKSGKHIGWAKLHGKLEREGYSKESSDKIAGSIKAKVNKSEELQKDEAPPAPASGQTINSQIGNPFGKSDEEPHMKGKDKLSHFMGYRKGKAAKGMNQDSGNNTPAQPINQAAGGEMDKGETGHEKGINTSTDPSQKSRVMMGTSKAGSTLPGHANDPKQKMADEAEAKGQHQQVLGEMKQMPKPKLPQ